MNLRVFTNHVPEEFREALVEFEKEFHYPLGESQRFSVSHGESYLPFFQAIGVASLLVAFDQRVVLGTIAKVERRNLITHAGGEIVGTADAHYLCDLKLRGASRGSMVLPRMIREIKRVIEAGDTRSCYCVVMDGTNRLPTDYTGRLGVPRFEKLAEIVILRVSTRSINVGPYGCLLVERGEFEDGQKGIPRRGLVATGGDSSLRSLMPPLRMLLPDRGACGILEDTRLGKRLYLDTGEEMLSAHLSGFAYQKPADGALILRTALAHAKDRGMAAVFSAVPRGEVGRLIPCLEGLEILQAPATIYGHALETGLDWWIDPADI